MTALRVIIADDEPPARRKLRRLLEAEPDIAIVGEAATGGEAVPLLRLHRPHALFLDIHMPGLDGFQVIEALDDLSETSVIFVTAYDEYAVRAFQVQALDYLLKPVDPDRLSEALARLRKRVQAQQSADPQSRYWKRILVDGARRTHLVNVEDIDWIEADRNYVVLHCGEQEYVVRATLTTFLERLNPDDFSRVNRSAAVNLNRVGEMQPRSNGDYLVRLSSGQSLSWSRRYVRPAAG